MNERASWNARYFKRRRLRLVALILLAVLTVLLLARGCGSASSGDSYSPLSSGASNSSSSSNNSDEYNETTESTKSTKSEASSDDSDSQNRGNRGGFLGLGGGGEKEKEDKNGGSGEPEKKPFAAIPPPEGAKPLKDVPGAANENGQYNKGAGQRNGANGNGGDLPAGRTLVRGAKDPSDGPLKDNRLVAYYGTPLSAAMGILGELPPKQMMAQLKKQTKAYSAADPEQPAVPTIELIASVAQRNPGPEGLYVQQTPMKEIRRYSKLAKENDALLLLDVQLGRDDLMNEVKRLEPFLKQEHVHLAIDTEYSVGPGEIPGVNLGTVAGSDVQRAVRYMDRLVERENVPDKLVVVHQFETGIVYNKENIKPTDDVQVSLNADGFGRKAAKVSKYDILVSQEPIQYGGFKVFYRQDSPVMSPDEVLQLEPSPGVVNYQ